MQHNASSEFHFPTDIRLSSCPLVEAWLEIRWRLEIGETPDLMTDPGFPFALGKFYESVRRDFGYREDLQASKAPLDMLPYVVRHQFRAGKKDGWPLVQLGPGVATVNFTIPYSWPDFRAEALSLRSKLLDAYEERLQTQMLALRYRNAVPCEYTSGDLLKFLRDNLNVSIELPTHIPGAVGRATPPTMANINLTFDLVQPRGLGTLRFRTGAKSEQDPNSGEELRTESVIFDLEVTSSEDDAPDVNGKAQFADWLESAHAVIHEWFFSLIEGPLVDMYKGEGG